MESLLTGQDNPTPPPLPTGALSFVIRLVGYDSDAFAQFVNPLTFHWNNVVEPSWVCEPSVVVGLTRSSFTYTNGVQVEATRSDVAFKQEATPLELNQAPIVGVVGRYVEAFGVDRYEAIAFEFAARISPLAVTQLAGSNLSEFLGRLKLNDINPRLEISTRYDSPNKVVAVTVGPEASPQSDYVICSGTVYRILDDDPERASAELRSILASWDTAWQEFTNAIVQLLNAVGDMRRQQ